MTLATCLETGIKNNPTLRASQFSVAAAGYDIKAARADFFPSVSSAYTFTNIASDSSEGPTDTDYLDQDIRSFNIKLTQILYAGSRIVNTFEKAKILEQVANADMDLVMLELRFNIETTFFRLMKARQDVITATESVNRLTESVKAGQAFFQKELVPYVDVLQARVDLADAEDRLWVAKNNVTRERVALFSLMNQPMDPGIEFLGQSYDTLTEIPPFDLSFKSAIENRPDIKSLKHQLEIQNKEADIVMGKYRPVVKVDVGYYDHENDYDARSTLISGNYDRDQKNRYWSTGIYATWDLFDGGKAWYGKQKYRAEAEKIKALIREMENMISTGIHKALYSMSEARQRITSSVDALAAAREYYAREERRLSAEISTLPSLLDAQDRLIRAQGNKTRAVLDYQLARSELKFMTGEKNRQDG